MNNLRTIYTSNVPINCHILKGRLETENITCFIYDENMVWVHPFKAIAIGGVKLKVRSDAFEKASAIIKLLDKNKLYDTKGEYNLAETVEQNYQIQTAILDLKLKIRKNPELIDTSDQLYSPLLLPETIAEIILDEIKFQKLRKQSLNFTVKQFLYELFDFNRNVFEYLRPRPVEYYLEKEIVDNYEMTPKNSKEICCPKCNSKNVSYGYAIDQKWDILYLLLSFFFSSPFPFIRKKFHCFDCSHDFKKNIDE